MLGVEEDSIHHFVAFVKCRDGNLWELEGSRKGPLNRGPLGEDDDAFSERALRRLIEIQRRAAAICLFLVLPSRLVPASEGDDSYSLGNSASRKGGGSRCGYAMGTFGTE